MTVGQQGGRIFPTGPGIGATQEAWTVMSFIRAAGSFMVITVPDPLAIMPGPPGTQPGSMQGSDWLVTTAASILPILTVGTVAVLIISGRPGWGVGVGTGAGG